MIPIVIPAYNPTARMLTLVAALRAAGVAVIVVVDDGSTTVESRRVLAAVAALPCCRMVAHATNQGKGQALKTAFAWVQEHLPAAAGVVTADCDGQHTPEDILRVQARLAREPQALVLGARGFDHTTPARSLVGNRLIRGLTRLVMGQRLTDTQTGLRGIPATLLPHLLAVDGSGYEYEMNMLTTALYLRVPVVEEPVRTVYLDGNASSHFSPIRDSMKISFALLRFSLSSLLASGVDFAVFTFVYALVPDILVGLIGARLVSSAVNFTVNRHLVFRVRRGAAGMLVKYYLLVGTMMLLSYAGIYLLAHQAHVNVTVAKIITETALFTISFLVQRDVVFKERATLARKSLSPV